MDVQGVRLWPVTFGANEKGGMDSEEFEKYVMNLIILLYPHVRNQHGKRVMLKVDSGPVRMNPNLLAGLVIRYKTQFLENLHLMQKNVYLSLQPKFVGLPLFRGIDTETSCNIEVSAFLKQAFLKSTCVLAFKRVGAATNDGVTRACLQYMQVIQSIGDGDDEINMLQHAVQTANKTAVYHLIQAGFDAQYLMAMVIKKVREERVTEPNTVARKLALAKAKGHGGRFHVTAHMTCNDLFIAPHNKQNFYSKIKLYLQIYHIVSQKH